MRLCRPVAPRIREPPSSVAFSPPHPAKSAAPAATSGSERRAVPPSGGLHVVNNPRLINYPRGSPILFPSRPSRLKRLRLKQPFIPLSVRHLRRITDIRPPVDLSHRHPSCVKPTPLPPASIHSLVPIHFST